MYDDTVFDAEQALQYADDLRSRTQKLKEEVEQTEIAVTSRDRAVTITVSIPGKVLNLSVNGSIFEAKTPEEIGQAILATIQTAQRAAEQAGRDLATQYLPNLPNLAEVLSGTQDKRRHQ